MIGQKIIRNQDMITLGENITNSSLEEIITIKPIMTGATIGEIIGETLEGITGIIEEMIEGLHRIDSLKKNSLKIDTLLIIETKATLIRIIGTPSTRMTSEKEITLLSSREGLNN
jgi:hypothetical protein